MRVFVDSWAWLTLEDCREVRHTEVASCVSGLLKQPRALVTSDYILDEVMSRLFSRRPFEEAWQFTQGVLASAQIGSIVVERVDAARFERAIALRKRFSDKPRISFTDLTSMVIMRDLKISDVLTSDDHFRQVGMGFRLLPS